MFWRYFLISIVFIFMVHTFLIQNQWVHYRKGESNYFSSRARAQESFRSNASIYLLGSSISGRIPINSNSLGQIANYSADGYTFAHGLKWLEMPQSTKYRCVVIETNTIDGAEIGHGLKLSTWEILGARFKPLSASARPSSIIYSTLVSRKDPPPEAKNFHLANYQVDFSASIHQSNWKPIDYHYQVLHKLSTLSNAGATIAFLEYPAGQRSRESYPNRLPFIEWLCRNLNASFYDCTSLEQEKHIQLSDGVHMDQNSATSFHYAIKEHQFSKPRTE